ncbi:MAG: aminotransferase [Rhizobiales bacterium]|nr:aminotransferase [Hyphomicrobiales bacterium]
MSYTVKPEICSTETPPISESFSWLPQGETGQAPVILSQAVPNYPPAAELQEHVAKLSGAPATSLYTDILGLEPLREAFAAHLSTDYDADIQPADVAITAGGNQAFCLAMMAIAQSGDNVIVPSPYFFNHQMWFDMQGIEVRHLQCRADNAMQPSVENAARLIDSRTRAMVLVSPNNPTGAVYPPALLEQMFDLCAGHGLALLIDETYKDFRGFPEPAHRLFNRPDWRNTFIHLHSFSKSFSLTGYRAGGMAASPELIGNVEKLLDCVAICAPHIGQQAVLFGLRNLDIWRAGKVAEMAGKLQALTAAFGNDALAYRMVSSGAFFAYVEHPFEHQTSKEVAMRLAAEHNLLVLPGSMFGEGQEMFLRIAFANASSQEMEEVVARLIASQ